MVDTGCWQMLLVALAGWVNRHQLDVIDYLREEKLTKSSLLTRGHVETASDRQQHIPGLAASAPDMPFARSWRDHILASNASSRA